MHFECIRGVLRRYDNVPIILTFTPGRRSAPFRNSRTSRDVPQIQSAPRLMDSPFIRYDLTPSCNEV